MTSLFIANISNKHNEFTFSLPGNPQLRRVIIPAGKQAEVLKNAQREEVDAVVSQHTVYGLVEQSQVAKIDKFSGALYSLDKPVKIENMEIGVERNTDFLLEEGYELRKLAAIAIDAKFSEIVADSHLRLPEQKATTIDVEEIPDEKTTKRTMLKQKIKVTKE
jgi:hypothetical protein